MQLVLQLDPATARTVRRTDGTHTDVGQLAQQLKVRIQPMHPQTTDEALSSYFTIEVADPALARRYAERFQRCPGVEAAYVKTPDEPA